MPDVDSDGWPLGWQSDGRFIHGYMRVPAQAAEQMRQDLAWQRDLDRQIMDELIEDFARTTVDDMLKELGVG